MGVVRAQCTREQCTLVRLNVSPNATFCSVNSPCAFSQSQTFEQNFMEAGGLNPSLHQQKQPVF